MNVLPLVSMQTALAPKILDAPRLKLVAGICRAQCTDGVDFQFFYVVKGWIKFVYDGQEGEKPFSAGDCVLQPAAIRHNELACSDDLEVLEIYSPAIHETRSVDDVPRHEAAA